MGEAAAKESTMEDILSSIRKIIAEEGEPEAGEAETALDSPAPALDAPVETSGPVETHREESQPNLQQIVDKVASVSEPLTDSADINAPAAPQPASVDPAPAAPAAPAAPPKAASLADIAASVKAQEISQSTAQAAPTPAKEEPTPQSSSPAPAAVAAPSAAAPQSVETETVEVEPQPKAHETKIEMVNAEPAPAPPAASEAKPAPAAGEGLDHESKAEIEESAFKGALMSPRSNNLVSDSFERLKRSVMDDLDAKTEAILRPMLREWLDENLPTMVERMVREEIERVARG